MAEISIRTADSKCPFSFDYVSRSDIVPLSSHEKGSPRRMSGSACSHNSAPPILIWQCSGVGHTQLGHIACTKYVVGASGN